MFVTIASPSPSVLSRVVAQGGLVFIEPIVGERHVAPVPAPPVAALVPADEQDCLALAVEGEQHPNLGRTR
jgi:hypothetical protein